MDEPTMTPDEGLTMDATELPRASELMARRPAMARVHNSSTQAKAVSFLIVAFPPATGLLKSVSHYSLRSTSVISRLLPEQIFFWKKFTLHTILFSSLP